MVTCMLKELEQAGVAIVIDQPDSARHCPHTGSRKYQASIYFSSFGGPHMKLGTLVEDAGW